MAIRVDPTRTGFIRKKFERDLGKKFLSLLSKIRKLILEEDALGLKRNAPKLDLIEQEDTVRRMARNQNVVNTRWTLMSRAGKLQAFNDWLATQIEEDIVDVYDSSGRHFTEGHVVRGYQKGLEHAYIAAKGAAGISTGIFEASKAQFLQDSFGGPIAAEKVAIIQAETLRGLEGITDSMAAQISQELTDGLISGLGPRDVARNINRRVRIGRRRATTIARDKIIKAHAEGNLDAFDMLNVEGVAMVAEWSDAGDDRVCEKCKPMDGVVLKVKEARGLIPRHPNCRCTWTPANVGEDDRETQKRSQTSIEKSIEESLRKELPRTPKKSRGVRSKWPGGRKTITKSRPKMPKEAMPDRKKK